MEGKCLFPGIKGRDDEYNIVVLYNIERYTI